MSVRFRIKEKSVTGAPTISIAFVNILIKGPTIFLDLNLGTSAHIKMDRKINQERQQDPDVAAKQRTAVASFIVNEFNY